MVALIVILFRDGFEVEAEMLQRHWHLPLRKLILAMPLTAAIIALATHLLTGLSWTESFLLGALLSPTPRRWWRSSNSASSSYSGRY